VPEASNQFVFNEPLVLWRMQRANGLQAHAVIGPRPNGAVIVWFVNDRPVGYREFDDWAVALGWNDRLQAQNWAVGWRHV
jgi:hypothetical protein